MRAVVRPEGEVTAVEWIHAVAAGRVEALAPDLVFAETAQALAGYARAGELSEGRAAALMREIVGWPLRITRLQRLVGSALEVAFARGLSVYDACYLALAESADAVLVTADRRLAEAAGRSALLPGAGPP